MAVLVKVLWVIASVISQLFGTNQMGCEQVFDNLVFERTDALRKQIHFVINYVQNYCFG